MNSTGKSPGFTLRNEGGSGSCGGSLRSEVEMADCTSSAAPSMLRSSANCKTIWVAPIVELEVIEATPEMVANWRSSGAATEEAMVSGLAPGKVA